MDFKWFKNEKNEHIMDLCFGGRSWGRKQFAPVFWRSIMGTEKHFDPSVQRSIIDVTQFPDPLTKPSFKIPALEGRWILIGQIPANP